MAALDLPIDTTGDTPEVLALKNKVREVAKVYTDRHGWCDQVKNALSECGIEMQPKTVKINITTALGMVFTVKAEPSLLAGKTEKKQKEALAELVGEVAIKGANAVGTFKISADAITSMELVPVPEFDDSPYWKYLSYDGQVLHLLTDGYQAARRDGSQTACGVHCFGATDTSSRGEDRRCVKCVRRQGDYPIPGNN